MAKRAPSKARKPQPRGSTGRWLDASDIDLREFEAKQPGQTVSPPVYKKPVQRRTKRLDAFLDAALSTRRSAGYEQKKRAVSVRGEGRNTFVKVQAKLTGQPKIKSKFFRNKESAKSYLEGLKRQKSTAAWWGISARGENDQLFAYQSPVSDTSATASELQRQDREPSGQKRDTDFRVQQALQSDDLRITVYTLELNGAKNDKTELGSGARSQKPKGRGGNGSRTKTQRGGDRAGKLAGAGSRKRTSATRKPAKKSRATRPDKRGGAAAGRASKKRSAKTRKR